MFGSLKKKLKDAVEKASKAIREEKKEPIIAEEQLPKEPVSEETHETKAAEPASSPVIEEKEPVTEEPAIEKEVTPQKEDIAAEPEEAKAEEKSSIIEPKRPDGIGQLQHEPAAEEAAPAAAKESSGLLKKLFRKKAPERTISVEEKKEADKLIELEEPAEKEGKKGLFSKILETTITEDDLGLILKELKLALLENDVAVDVVEKISDDVSNELRNKSVRRGEVEDTIKAALRNSMLGVMKQEKIDLKERIEGKDGVYTIMFLGFNGVGKTTCLAKVAKKFGEYKPIIAAADTFRAASIEQLEEHGRRAGFRVVKHQYGADPAAVIFDTRKAAVAAGSRLVLADTAGRSHSNVNLMDELRKINRVNSPDLKILVLDSVTGNDIYEQSRLFNDAVGVDAIILTKADVYEKGGAALSATYTIKKPILYLGVGQEYTDLKEFNAEEIVDSLLKE